MANLTVESVRAKLTELKGNVSAVARAFDVARSSVYSFIEDHPELMQALTDARETFLDNVESRFYLDCLKDNPAYQTSRIFCLKTQGKTRGYVERHEMTGADGAPLAPTLNLSNLDDAQLRDLRTLLAAAGAEPESAEVDG